MNELDWSYFDQIYCINLITRQDRYQTAKHIFDTYQIPVKFHRVQPHPTDGAQGCFESHLQIIKEAWKSGAKNCLIFEDDILATSHLKSETLKEAIDFMEGHEYNIFYLGMYPNISNKRYRWVSGNIYDVSALNTHAYIISRKLMGRMLGMEYVGIPIDQLYCWVDKCYAIIPSLFQQGLSTSNINDSTLRSNIKTPAYNQLVELYAIYIGCPVFQLLIASTICYIFVTIGIIIFPRRAPYIILLGLIFFLIILALFS